MEVTTPTDLSTSGGSVASQSQPPAATAAVTKQTKKPINAFLLFCKRHRAIAKEKNPHLENRLISKLLGEWWTSLEPHQKADFNNLASQYKDHLMRDQPAYTSKKAAAQAAAMAPAAAPVAAVAAPAVVAMEQTVTTSRGSSGASSPEIPPSPPSACADQRGTKRPGTDVPKPFKKRYLAAEKAKMDSNSSSSCSSPTEQQKLSRASSVSNPEEKACEALLQLAEGYSNRNVPLSNPSSGMSSASTSRSGTSSPREEELKTLPEPGSIQSEAEKKYPSVREAVWSKIAKTLKLQQDDSEKSKMNAIANANGQPINLTTSTMTKIAGQTIIEHVIENILDKPMHEKHLNNNTGADGEEDDVADRLMSQEDEEKVKETILASLRKAALTSKTFGNKSEQVRQWKTLHNQPTEVVKTSLTIGGSSLTVTKTSSVPAREPVSVTVVPHPDHQPLNLSTTPPQTPASSLSPSVTITTAEEKQQRACKGRRYQEFKEAVGRKGRRQKSGSSHEGDSTMQPLVASNTQPQAAVAAASVAITAVTANGGAPVFDVEKELQAIPALSLESFQQKMRQQQSQAAMAAAAHQQAVATATAVQPVTTMVMGGHTSQVVPAGVAVTRSQSFVPIGHTLEVTTAGGRFKKTPVTVATVTAAKSATAGAVIVAAGGIRQDT